MTTTQELTDRFTQDDIPLALFINAEMEVYKAVIAEVFKRNPEDVATTSLGANTLIYIGYYMMSDIQTIGTSKHICDSIDKVVLGHLLESYGAYQEELGMESDYSKAMSYFIKRAEAVTDDEVEDMFGTSLINPKPPDILDRYRYITIDKILEYFHRLYRLRPEATRQELAMEIYFILGKKTDELFLKIQFLNKTIEEKEEYLKALNEWDNRNPTKDEIQTTTNQIRENILKAEGN